MIRIFMPMSGNLGDTLNVMPVLSGIFKSTGHKISLTVKDKMKSFNGFREFMQYQDCIAALKFESEVKFDDTFQTMSLVDEFTLHENRPYETVRLEEDFKRRYNIKFEVDDSFILKVPELTTKIEDKFIVADRTMIGSGDTRRAFDFLKTSEKFPLDKCLFLDYNKPILHNASIINETNKPIFTTFTGTSNIADLLKKECVVLWDDTLKNWDNKPIEYSFNKHFYRDRKCTLKYLGDFNLQDYEVRNEI